MTQAPRLKSISDIHAAMDRREISPVELTEQYLIAAKQSTHNAYLTICADEARARAKGLQSEWEAHGKVPRDRYPLFAIPMGAKDNLATRGVRTTCGSKILENYIPPYTATAWARLEAAGGITLGKLNLDEFAMGGSNENSAYGPVQHPTHAGYVPGGSSGGSASAVRAGLCAASVGTDTGGSIRLPASFCGVVGMKPTYGRVSRYGLVAFASSLDQAGPLTNTVADAAAMLQAMAAHDVRDSTSSTRAAGDFTAGLTEGHALGNLKGLRIGIPKEYFVEGVSAEVDRAVRAALAWYEAQGARLVPISLPHTEHSIAVYYLIAVSEASTNLSRFDGVRFGVRPRAADQAADLAEFYQKVRAQFGPEVKRRIILGTFALSSGYYDAYFKRASQVRRLIANDFAAAFEKVDVIASPVAPTTAFKLGEKVSDPLQMYLNDIFTVTANLAGIPGLSLPCGEDAQGLSIGLQLMGPRFGDERLLAVAHRYEQAHSAKARA